MGGINAKKIVLVTNHLTPYRRKFYDDFFNACKKAGIEFSVLLMTKREPKRNWNYDNLKVDYAYLMKGYHFSFPINNHLNFEVLDKLKEIKPDLVLMAGSYMYCTNWLVLLNKKKLDLPVIYWNEAHFNEKRNYNKLILKIRDSIRNSIFPHFDGYWYSGELSKKFVTHYSNKSAKLYFLPNFIDNEMYNIASKKSVAEISEIKNKFEIPLENTVIIIPARLSIEKGIHLFIDFLKKVENSNNLTVLIPGTGPYKDVIENKVANSDIDIRLLGFQDQETMIEMYSIAKIFVLPSLSDPNPLTCIEALWSGLPLFISKHVGNYPEVVEEGVNGYVFDYLKEEDAINKLSLILKKDDNWHQSAKLKSLEIANSIYHSEFIIKNVINQMVSDFISVKC